MILQTIIDIVMAILEALLDIIYTLFPQINLRGTNGTNVCENNYNNDTSK